MFKCPAPSGAKIEFRITFFCLQHVGPDAKPIHYGATTLNCAFKEHDPTQVYYSLSSKSNKGCKAISKEKAFCQSDCLVLTYQNKCLSSTSKHYLHARNVQTAKGTYYLIKAYHRHLF